VLHNRPPRPSGINPAVPAAFEGILSRALAKDPLDRYRNAAELRSDLEQFADNGAAAAAPADATVAMAAPTGATMAMTGAETAAAAEGRRRRRAEHWLIGIIIGLVLLAVVVALLAANRDSGDGGEEVMVPPVVGLTQDAAVRQLQAAGLKPVVASQPDPSRPVGTVVSTNPPPGTSVPKDSEVTLNVSSGPATTTTTRRVTTTRATSPPTTEPPVTEPTSPPTTASRTTISVIVPTTSGSSGD
jgi:serine/threonine-protein kinase